MTEFWKGMSGWQKIVVVVIFVGVPMSVWTPESFGTLTDPVIELVRVIVTNVQQMIGGAG